MSEDVPEELSSAVSSQSSIIKPSILPSDTRFFTFKIFGGAGHNPAPIKLEDVIVAGSNLELLANTNTWGLLQFRLRRQSLKRLHRLYGLLLDLWSWVQWTLLVLDVYFWWLVRSLGIFPSSVDKPLEPSTAFSQMSNEPPSQSRIRRILQLRTTIGNHALAHSLATSIPKSQLTVRQALAGKRVPKHLMAIYELNPLVVPPPRELPTPYLTAEKKIVVPDKKEISQVLSERAEWAAAHHTHKASEVMRVCAESARLVSWALFSGVKSLTLYERSGNPWKNLERLGSMIQTEISALSDTDSFEKTWIKLVRVNNSETITIENNEIHRESPDRSSGEDSGLAKLQPAPASSQLESAQISETYSAGDGLTITLVSEEDGGQRMAKMVRNFVQFNGDVSEIESYVDKELAVLDSPELIIKFARRRGMPQSLSGAPIYNFENRPLFAVTRDHTNFPFFIQAVDLYSQATAKKE
ncbi:hypothetical protein KL918_004578 [Ogataea parapolymorpha]|uniref:ditrans,polycis-polyprenyl diphosphate synthase [(2E,6E)-farnesyldiphosphate specific] n=1 Tax=Ogataea parapolymorpha (strain ATCC 26012 / BCRC 20466 / JCM 22074 / NRRL Y-7560 / DL-1) TaxID=871575 RepID=W1QLU0_OGAPD|nr:hypothetical protein HPODL_00036 [Ogataea parapolymorpha DL-1]ESX03534.1 hypothetical protein HPODL_00036 [Ogataea parapolymorpha DL-1]KAG7865336.1 hypothetical protein KL918_004578 [Ogataea parapolymorpha]KAG7873781.1 hypothetical protein KL916_001941 [Ogataea parapolymorpha]